jgi:cell fate (sporulation/competence/biofilm development) regulator YlbF (YheA/YmcA/DUF963 family)
MQAIAETDAVVRKTRELCQAILDQPEFTQIKQQVDDFMNDELAKFKFQMLTQKGNLLQMKQQHGAPMVESEITEFQRMREELMENPVARGFLEAQEKISRVHDSIFKHLNKTYELGRLPTDEDFEDGSCCDSTCGCQH